MKFTSSEQGWTVSEHFNGRDYAALFAFKPSKREARKVLDQVMAESTRIAERRGD